MANSLLGGSGGHKCLHHYRVSHDDHHTTSSPENEQTAKNIAAPPVRDDKDSGDIVLPFGLRSISTANLTDEMTNGGQVFVGDSGGGDVPREVTRDGDLFLVRTRETERKAIQIAAYSGNSRVTGNIIMSGYTVAHMPCDFRAFYLPTASFSVSDTILQLAMKISNNSSCAAVDKRIDGMANDTRYR